MGTEAASPICGYIDAPFFTDIDRRNTNMSLQLNRLLMEVAAETCAAAALSVVSRELDIGASAVFDLFAWTGGTSSHDASSTGTERYFAQQSTRIPVMAPPGKQQWSSLEEVSICYGGEICHPEAERRCQIQWRAVGF